MRNRSNKISRIVALAKSEEQRVGAELGKSRSSFEEQAERLGQLNAYRHSYQQRSSKVNNASSAHWKDYQNFMQRMELAVRSQLQMVNDAELNLEKHRQRWMQKRQRLNSLQQVLDGYRDAEESYAEKLRQRALDDLPPPGNPYPGES
jgi:flagellar FliJ protein